MCVDQGEHENVFVHTLFFWLSKGGGDDSHESRVVRICEHDREDGITPLVFDPILCRCLS